MQGVRSIAPCRSTSWLVRIKASEGERREFLRLHGQFNRPEERNSTMPNPKRRHSARRTAIRRAHDFLTAVGLSDCPTCHEKKLPHRACAKCGEYKGRAVLEVKDAEK
jgi:large subunit ribosomal protein L32